MYIYIHFQIYTLIYWFLHWEQPIKFLLLVAQFIFAPHHSFGNMTSILPWPCGTSHRTGMAYLAFWAWWDHASLYQRASSCSITWWRHPMEKFSALLAICAGNSPVTGEFPAQMPVTGSFDVFFDLRLNKRLRKHSWGWWFETPSHPLWRQRNDILAHGI